MKNIRKSVCKFVCVSSFCISNGLFGNSATALGLSDVLHLINQDVAQKFLRLSDHYNNIDDFMMLSGLGPDFDVKMEKGMVKLINQFGLPDFNNLEDWLIGDGLGKGGFVEGFVDLLTNSLVEEDQTFVEFLKENSGNAPLMRNIENMVNNLMGGLAGAVIYQMSGSFDFENIRPLIDKIDVILKQKFQGVSFDNLSGWKEGLIGMLDPDSSNTNNEPQSPIDSAAYDALSDLVFRRGQNLDQLIMDSMIGSLIFIAEDVYNYKPGLMVQAINDLIPLGLIDAPFDKDHLTQDQLDTLATFGIDTLTDLNNLTNTQKTTLASFGLDGLDKIDQLKDLVELGKLTKYDPYNLTPMQQERLKSDDLYVFSSKPEKLEALAELGKLTGYKLDNLTAEQQEQLKSLGLDTLYVGQLEILAKLGKIDAYDPKNLSPMQQQIIDSVTLAGFDPSTDLKTQEQGRAFFLGTEDGKGGFIPKFMNLFVESITGDKYHDMRFFLWSEDTPELDLDKSVESVWNDLIAFFDGKESILGFSTFAELKDFINAQFLKTFNKLDPYDVSTWNEDFMDHAMKASSNEAFSEAKKVYNERCPDASACAYVISYEDGMYSPKVVAKQAA